ncbi:MAG: DUF4956 domain-containing protein [Acidobacteria bacterium]|nr:DUF4956 domain-containing protein [Acidobacteriota bacterium]
MGKEDRLLNNRRNVIIAALLAGLVGFGVVALILRSRGEQPAAPGSAVVQSTAPDAQSAATDGQSAAAEPTTAAASSSAANSSRQTANTNDARRAPQKKEDEALSFFEEMIGAEDTEKTPSGEPRNIWTTLLNVTIRLTLAALLSAMLAFRPRRFALFFKRNLFVAQTQILLAVVASALMMIVGDSAARAFGIFAAVSLVRFRTNIRDPKEITVLLVSLAIGLATGVGRWEVAIILSIFVLLLLWGLEYRESELVFRSMELTVKTRDVEATQKNLLDIFKRYNFSTEMRQLDRPDAEDEMGCIVYNVEMSPLVSTDRISNDILTSDPQNVDSVEWDQQKNAAHYLQ